MTLERLSSLGVPGFLELAELSEAEGFLFLRRLVDEWESGANRFEGPGESFWGAFSSGRVVAVGGLNCGSGVGVGRLRRFYVHPGFRRRGVGRELLGSILKAAVPFFEVIELRTNRAEAAAFYEANGFLRVDGAGRTHLLHLSRLSPTG